MLEGLVAWVLNNYLGKYVENLNTDQLSVAMLSGKVELENLPLKKDALRHLGVPVQVKAGFIGKVQLQVPVRQIRSAPWVIAIDKLYLVASPVNLDEWDSELEANMEQERKVAILDALEAQWRAESEARLDSGYYAASYSSWLSYGTGLLTNIVENLQLKLNDVHIRYEDAITCGERHAFACGLTVESLSAESCDSSWQKGFTLFSSDGEGCSFKLIELQKLAIYWDPVPMPIGLLANYTLSELAVRMSQTWNSNHNYIVSPSTAIAYVKRERCEQPLRSKARPRINCNLTLDQVFLNLTDRQFNECVGCSRGLELIARWKSFRRWRPHVPVGADARAWWIYAIKCHYPNHFWMDPKPTWESCLERARKSCEYVKICLSILTNPTATLPPDKKAAKDEYEWNTPLELLKPLREVAIRAVPKAAPVAATPESNATGRSMLVAWFPQWWGWYGSQPSSQDSETASYQAALDNSESNSVPNLEEEILDVLADSIENNTLLKRDTVFGHFDFTLNKGCLNLSIVKSDGENEMEPSAMLELQFEKVCLGVESRPRTGSHALSIALGTMCLRDRITPHTLFPILIAPQGTIREGLSSMNVTSNIMSWYRAQRPGATSPPPPAAPPPAPAADPLFQLTYERRPFSSNCDYKLYVKSQSLEVVYNSGSVKWLSEFISNPFSSNNGNGLPQLPINEAYAHMRDTTKMHLMNKWENILQGNLGERSTWQIELDISAPQIMFVEDFTDKNGIVMVVDFGKMHLTNGALDVEQLPESITEDEDLEMFMTPCSTPPGSVLSPGSPLPLDAPPSRPAPNSLDQQSLHRRLYDRYKVELSDLQFLVGRARDNWKYAHTKGTSSLHLLDRFSISLQAERRVVYTSDPQFPSATLCGTLPHLVVHLNEQKIAAVRSILAQISTTSSVSPQSSSEVSVEKNTASPPSDEPFSEFSETEHTERSSNQLSKLFMLQFAIDQLALEVQSRGRSIAEVQVCGVRASFTKRPFDYSLSLSVHSLLLVDALQTYGPDFELLVASHKHVGMDCASGSMRDSEPTSPTSPASPDGRYPPAGAQPPPHALAQALHSLHAAPPTLAGVGAANCASPVVPLNVPGLVDSEALIAVELTVVRASAVCPEELRIANILFNNLDIIANQETIVELIGFVQRVFAPRSVKRLPSEASLSPPSQPASGAPAPPEEADVRVRSEVTFDFHRLSVLLLRAAADEGTVVAKKIATATMSEAKIQATIGKESLEVKGSLGGLQVVSLCPGSSVHTRIVSVGQDSLQPPPPDAGSLLLSSLARELYRGVSTGSLASTDEKAFVFSVKRTLEPARNDLAETVKACVCVHVASVWYTHSGPFLGELRSCVTEFKQYLSNLARSIKAAAADMAIGLVQPRVDTLYSNPKLSQSMEGVSPRRRTTSMGLSLDNDSIAECLKSDKIVLSVDVELETPVVVLPRAPASTHVFVAHLGKMFLDNRPLAATTPATSTAHDPHHYNVQVRDITLFSLDIGERLKTYNISADNMQSIYNAGAEGKPVLHNTTLQLSLHHSDVLHEGIDAYEPTTQIMGKIVTPLRVSATREQFEQLLDTVKTLGVSHVAPSASPESRVQADAAAADSAGVTTLSMDPQLRAELLTKPPPTKVQPSNSLANFMVNFQLPSFTVELRGDFGNGERSLVDLSFRDFNVNYEKCHRYETNIRVSLHSITMEDLTQEMESKHRLMMVSHTPHVPRAVFVSKSCPDFVTEYPGEGLASASSLRRLRSSGASVPSRLDAAAAAAGGGRGWRGVRGGGCGATPPCSPRPDDEPPDTVSDMSADDNLVLISVHLRDSQHPLFEEKYARVSKSTKVDFNCLNLVVSIDSWVAVLDFFGIVSDEGAAAAPQEFTSDLEEQFTHAQADQSTGITETEMSIRSLSMVLVGHRGEVCRANISRLALQIWGDPAQAKKSVEGSLGSMSLSDLTQHGKIWRERFLTSGQEALSFHYKRLSSEEAVAAEWETTLSIGMSSISFVHTKRFVAELQAFFRDFSLLQRVLVQARQKVSVASASHSDRLHLSIECRSPLILVPVSSRSRSVLVVDLGRLKLDNSFKRSGERGTISTLRDPTDPVREMLDVRIIQLENMDLFCGERRDEPLRSDAAAAAGALRLGRHTHIQKRGPSLLTENCRLVLQLENNMDSYHNVPDMTIQGTLDTLECALDPDQYKLIRGLLTYNMGESIDDLSVSSELVSTPSAAAPSSDSTWTLTSIKLDLLNVTLRLETEHRVSSLACINFIKSRLVVETYSDLSQDIDLVSQEILVSDTRYQREPANKRSNVFTSIVQPMSDATHSVQAEVHARKRREHSAYTILVNNMRLMAIMDWWEAVNQFLLQPPSTDFDTREPMFIQETRHDVGEKSSRQSPSDETQIELKLNITESQVVLVEDTSLWDTNAVILKSTTVISYRPGSELKPVSCVLNHCEVFSCVLGLEEETALSIIDPVTLHIDLDAHNVLRFQVGTLNVRLSYHDMRMFAGMLQSLPAQARVAGNGAQNSPKPPAALSIAPANSKYLSDATRRLSSLGFSTRDCATALATCAGSMDEAALWLTQHARAVPLPPSPHEAKHNSALWPLSALLLRADCITICVIDDCLDSDVPLLELSLAELTVNQDLRHGASSGDPLLVSTPQSPPLMSPETELAREALDRQTGPGGGRLRCLFSGDYYNRCLSGWEPVVEPWRCEASWEYTLTSGLNRNRLQLEVNSTEILNINITSTLIDLYKLVKTNWTQDYYSLTPKGESSPKNSPPGYRRRSPFVPFALNNQTGHKLWFTTFITSSDEINEGEELSEMDDSWSVVRPGETEAFSFGSRRRRGRGRAAGPRLRLHQLGVRVDGWGAIGPVCVDRVGLFFRHATHTKSDVEARVVFAVTLEGSARKLVTVRSALQLVNDLPQPIEVRIDSGSSSGTQWGLMSLRSVQVGSGQTWSAPLVPSGLPLWVRPLPGGARHPFLYCVQPLDWRVAARRSPAHPPLLAHHVCHSSGDQLYRFCCIIRREKFPSDRGMPMPGHTLVLKPALRIVNLLPVDLHYSVDSTAGAIAPGATEPFHQVNVEESVEMSFKLDGFANSTLLTVPPTTAASFLTKVKMIDNKGRRLYLNAHISIKRSDTIKVSVSAPYWIVNRTGIPIVFRQEGVASETAGQYEEHEVARMVAPLLFSFAESEGSPTVVMRIGASVPGQSQWCSSFGLGPGTVVRRLVARGEGGAGGERVCLVGVCVRAGRGRYRRTNICTICPRYQLHNKTSYHLQFAQKCLATSLRDPGASATHLSAISGCYMPFHWPRPDRDQLLCVRPLDAPHCHWSGGFHIDTNNSLHISCRDAYGAYYFLRLEVVLQGATFFIVFTDADTMPPAIRLENCSPITIIFHQASCKDEVMLPAHTSTAWALSEPCGAAALVLGAPGGGRTSVQLQLPGEAHTLTYQNFIYVAFSGTHASLNPMSPGEKVAATVEDSQLVLEVPVGTTKVILGKKRYGDRSQLWRRGPNHQLIHEGSSPPQASNLSGWEEAPLSPHALVLDIEGPAPRPGTATPLALRRADPRRVSTQAWRLAAPGRMCCAHANLCLQPEDGFFGLRPGSRVVLGLPGPASSRSTPTTLPIEQAVSWQTLRPGSGILDISVFADGPTRVIKIVDAKDPDKGWIDGNASERNGRGSGGGGGGGGGDGELELRVALGGLGVSLVARSPPEELLYALFSGILMELARSPRSKSLNLSVQDMQCDNQLLGAASPVLLHVTRPRGGGAPAPLPAVHLSLDLTPSPPPHKYNAAIFKHFIITFRPVSVRLEERLLLKVCVWGGLGRDDNSTEELDETDFETHRILNEVTAVHAKRYYFGVIKIVPSQIRLSMQTSSKLSAELSAVKRHLNLTLIKFEDAGVELEPFVRWHPFETGQFLWHLIIKHFKDELKWQAAKILGSVDFLGNPLGFVQDVSEGVTGLLYEGNVGALVKNVTHGLSNSAAKVTESLGDGLERVVVDEAHEETRRRIRSTGGAGSHLVAGFRGLGLGILGGVTSLVKHSYEGATQEGIPGFFTGVGKGLVGTVTKPVIGVLDLAAETASALRDTSRRSDKWVPERMRPTRCAAGAGGLLPRYSRTQSVGHQFLYAINGDDYTEGFLAYEVVRDTPLDIRALLSTHYLRIFTCKAATPHIVMETHLSNLMSCVAVSTDNCHFVEMGVRGGGGGGGDGGGGGGGGGLRRPRVQCDTAALAAWVARQAAYAKRMYNERLHTLHPHSYS